MQKGGRLSSHGVGLFVDETGVGLPVVRVLKAAQVKGAVLTCFFTHGDRRTEQREGTRLEVKIGKAWLVSRLQGLLQQSLLHLPKTIETDALFRELPDYEIRVDDMSSGPDKRGVLWPIHPHRRSSCPGHSSRLAARLRQFRPPMSIAKSRLLPGSMVCDNSMVYAIRISARQLRKNARGCDDGKDHRCF